MQYKGDTQTFSVIGGEIELSSFGLIDGVKAVSVAVDEKNIPFEQKDAVVCFENVKVRSMLRIRTER